MKKIIPVVIFLVISFQNGWAQSNACLESQSFKIVVLGSSTAAGSGVSTADSAWVNRYREYVQGINPNNEVINLAVGGYNTYKIMPTGFVPPVNRPLSDTNKNITKALSLNPDAIIVNLPSNDVSSGFSVSEQLFNLDSVFALSNLNNVPIWICTTQPKNFSSAATRQIQEDIKDSINLIYGSFALDFWTTIALPDNSIDSVYNADGTHLNDAGHQILVNRVIDADILNNIFSSVTHTDFWTRSVTSRMVNLCGDSATLFEMVIANIGIPSAVVTTVYFELENMTTGVLYQDSIQLSNSLASCSYDTILFYGNTIEPGQYLAKGFIYNFNDSVPENDSSMVNFTSIGHPIVNIANDTLCAPSSGVLEANTAQGDQSFWYLNYTDSNAVAVGATFQTAVVDSTSSWFVETVRGNLFYSGALETTSNSNINWNGAMFDVIGIEDVIIDSFDVKIASLGTQEVEIFYKTGSYSGFELDPTAWVFLGIDTVNVQSITDFTSVDLGNLPVNSGDTVGVYIQMANASSNLSYQSVSSPMVRANNELVIVTGSGVSYNQTNSYYPRDWNGKVYYHYGDRPGGECKTERSIAQVFVSQSSFVLGDDTIVDIMDSVTFYGPNGATSYLWFDGSMNQDLSVNAADLGVGIHYVNLEVEDSLKCFFTDELVLAIADLVSVNEHTLNTLEVFPNPVRNTIHIEAQGISSISIITMSGLIVIQQNTNSGIVDVSSLKQGVYIVKISVDGTDYFSRIVKR
jgi:lysophospholipase L1-like esterase